MPRQEFPLDGFDLGGGSLELSNQRRKSSPRQPRNLGLLRVGRFEERRRGFEHPVQPRFEDQRLERFSRSKI
jgi:exopolyphosphatase/pppGpp-phosphohydrolase